MEEGFFLKENKDSIIKIEKTIPNKFGCIELGFVEKKEKIINEIKLFNHQHGIILEYHLKEKITKEMKITVFYKNEPIQTVLFMEKSSVGIIREIGHKDLKNFVTYAKYDQNKKVIFLKWNNRQKSMKTLIVVKYES
jgi:hypothetical protein